MIIILMKDKNVDTLYITLYRLQNNVKRNAFKIRYMYLICTKNWSQRNQPLLYDRYLTINDDTIINKNNSVIKLAHKI